MRCGWPLRYGVNRQRQNFCALLALGVQPIELIDGALQQIIAFAVRCTAIIGMSLSSMV